MPIIAITLGGHRFSTATAYIFLGIEELGVQVSCIPTPNYWRRRFCREYSRAILPYTLWPPPPKG